MSKERNVNFVTGDRAMYSLSNEELHEALSLLDGSVVLAGNTIWVPDLEALADAVALVKK